MRKLETLAECTARAREVARRTRKRIFVIELDYQEGRGYSICDPEYLDTDEFFAFAGYLMAIVFPDGEVERWEDNPRQLVRN